MLTAIELYLNKSANDDAWFDYLGIGADTQLEEDPHDEPEDPDEHETSDTDREFARYVADHGLDVPVGGDFGEARTSGPEEVSLERHMDRGLMGAI